MKRLDLRVIILVLVAIMTVVGVKKPEAFAGEYVIGVIADLTGPSANHCLPQTEGFRIYIEQLNDKGGINGNLVRLFIEDDRAEGTRAAAAATKLTGKGITMLIHTSMSSTYQASMPVAKKAGIPWIVGASPHPEVMPPNAHPLIFANRTLGYATMSLRFMHYAAKIVSEKFDPKEEVQIFQSDVETPMGAVLQKNVPQLDAELGIKTAGMQLVPMSTSDFSPLAARIMESGANWVTGQAPTFLHAGMFKKLISSGYKGRYLADAISCWEDVLGNIKSSQFLSYSDKALFMEDLPIHKEIRRAAEKYKTTSDVTHLSYGWAMGMWVEAALRKAGWPYTPQDLVNAMSHLEVNLKGLMYPIKFTPKDHHGPTAFRVYGWSEEKRAVVYLTNWYRVDADTLRLTDIGTSLP